MTDDQYSIYDQVVDDGELEQALERRQKCKDNRAEAQQAFKTEDDSSKALIAALGLEDGTVVRCGRFAIKIAHRAARTVQFETEESTRTTIKLLDLDL